MSEYNPYDDIPDCCCQGEEANANQAVTIMKLQKQNAELLEALEAIAIYEPKPEIIYDEWAYSRMLEAVQDCAKAATAKARGE